MRNHLVSAMALSIGIVNTAIADNEGRQQVSFDTYGVVCQGCAERLGAAFLDGKVKLTSGVGWFDGRRGGKAPKPNKGKGASRVTAMIDPEADLAEVAKAIKVAKTPHMSQSPPGLAVVLFASMNKDAATSAVAALGSVGGVDAKGSKANARKNEISVRLTGEKEVTLAGIMGALRSAGIDAKSSKEGK